MPNIKILATRGASAATMFSTLDLLGKHSHAVPRWRRLLLAAESALADKKNSATDPQLEP
jgi:hypothetical protein